MGLLRQLRGGAGLSRTFCQQFLASLKTGSQLSREPPAALPEPPRDAMCAVGVCLQMAWKEVALPVCTCVFVCQLCRWNHPEVCARVLYILVCGFTHFRLCENQTSTGWYIDKSGFGVSMGICQQWVVVCAGPCSPMLTWADMCCQVLADGSLCGYPWDSESPSLPWFNYRWSL